MILKNFLLLSIYLLSILVISINNESEINIMKPEFSFYTQALYVNSSFIDFQLPGKMNFMILSSKDLADLRNKPHYFIKSEIGTDNFYDTTNLGNGYYAPTNLNPYGTIMNSYYLTFSRPSAIGIVDYGIEVSDNGSRIPYDIKYDTVFAYARIYSILAYNPNPPSGVPPYGASLQLNVILQVNTGFNTQQYWLQNVVGFDTQSNTYYYLDSIWNFTGRISILDSEKIYGFGRVFTFSNSENYYMYWLPAKKYSLPLDLTLVVKVSYNHSSVVVSFGYYNYDKLYWYDNVTILISRVVSAYMLVSGRDVTGRGLPYDAEFVFAGAGNYEATTFYQMDSLLYMYYMNNNTVILPKTLFSFSSNTAEKAYNIYTYSYKGVYRVTIGNSYYHEIKKNFTEFNSSIVSYTTVTDTGIPAHFNISFEGGTPPYIINFSIVDANSGKVIQTQKLTIGLIGYLYKNFTLQPGNYIVEITIKDFNDSYKKFSYSLKVNPNPNIELRSNTTVTDVGIPILINIEISGGTPPFNITWIINGKSNVSYTGLITKIKRIFNTTQPGYYMITVIIKDNAGYTTQKSLNIAVNQKPNFKILISTSNSLLRINSSVNILINTNNGTPPYQYFIYLNNENIISGYFNNTSLSKSLELPNGKNNLTVIVRDYYGISSRYTFIINTQDDYSLIYLLTLIFSILVIGNFISRKIGRR
ncbi:MAG: thermopsin [Sulfolobaceae archaeon]